MVYDARIANVYRFVRLARRFLKGNRYAHVAEGGGTAEEGEPSLMSLGKQEFRLDMLTEEIEEKKTVRVALVPAQRSLGTKIMRSVVSGGLRYVLVAPIPFIMTPLILHRIGVAGYGTWAVFLAINGLTSLADLGLMGTLSKFVAEYYAHQDISALSRLLNSGLTLFLLLDLAIGTAYWCASPLLANRLFRGSTVPITELVVPLRCFLIVIAANILTQLFSSVTTGLQRLDLSNVISTANILLSAFLVPFFC